MIEALVNTIALVVVVVACALHLRGSPCQTSHCEKWGFVITIGGALGVGAEWWLPSMESWHADTVLSIGLALIAVSTGRDRLRAVLGWDGRTERRSRA